MSPIDPRELGHGLTPTGTFEDGYRCVKCSYDLTGLPRATVCPECGTANAQLTYDKRRGTGVSRAPTAYVKKLGSWLWLAAFALIGTWFMGAIAGVFPHPVTFGLRLLVVGAWVSAVWLATTPKPDRYEPGTSDVFDNPRLRLATAIGQAMWIAVIGLEIGAWFAGNAQLNNSAAIENALFMAAGIARLAAAAGFVPLGIMLASLANWMGDDDAERRCQTASWLIAFYGVGVLLASFIGFLGIFYVVFWIAYLAGVIMLAMSLIALARAANWAVQNTKHKSVVSGRRAVHERQKAMAAEARLDERLVLADSDTNAAGRRQIPKGVPVPKSHTIDRGDGTQPYEVKDD